MAYSIGAFVRVIRGHYTGMSGVIAGVVNGLYVVRLTATGQEIRLYGDEIRRDQRASDKETA